MKTMKRLIIAFLLSLLSLGAQTTTPKVNTYTAKVGQTATLSATCSGTPPFTYQWFKAAPGSTQSAAIPGATAAYFLIKPLTLQDAGTYTVQIANQAGQAMSSDTVFIITALPPSNVIVIVTISN